MSLDGLSTAPVAKDGLGEIAEEGERARRGFHHRDAEDTEIDEAHRHLYGLCVSVSLW